jgi:hypothetical protein
VTPQRSNELGRLHAVASLGVDRHGHLDTICDPRSLERPEQVTPAPEVRCLRAGHVATAVRLCSRQPVEVADRHAARAALSFDDHDRVERDEGDTQVRGMGCDAVVAGAEDRERAVCQLSG